MSDCSSWSHDLFTITTEVSSVRMSRAVPLVKRFNRVSSASLHLSGGQKERLAVAVATLVHTGEFCVETAVEGMELWRHEY